MPLYPYGGANELLHPWEANFNRAEVQQSYYYFAEWGSQAAVIFN